MGTLLRAQPVEHERGGPARLRGMEAHLLDPSNVRCDSMAIAVPTPLGLTV